MSRSGANANSSTRRASCCAPDRHIITFFTKTRSAGKKTKGSCSKSFFVIFVILRAFVMSHCCKRYRRERRWCTGITNGALELPEKGPIAQAQHRHAPFGLDADFVEARGRVLNLEGPLLRRVTERERHRAHARMHRPRRPARRPF